MKPNQNREKKSGKPRLLKFLFFFCLILVALEGFVRAQGSYFFMLSDKLLLKVAILKRAEETRVLFLGTSRFLDAIAEQDFTDELEKLTGERIKT